MHFYPSSKDTLARLAQDIYNAFQWDKSPEGHTYWAEVANKLKKYQQEASKSSECKEEIAELKRRIAELEKRC